jgi:hypothetical protein
MPTAKRLNKKEDGAARAAAAPAQSVPGTIAARRRGERL